MTFRFDKESITVLSPEGIPMGRIFFPRVRAGLVNIDSITVSAAFRQQGVEEAMTEALLAHLERQGLKAVLTCPFVQQYVQKHPQWAKILPGEIHFTKY